MSDDQASTPSTEAGVQANLANWNERVPIHLDSPFYGEHFALLESGKHCLHDLTLQEMGDVAGCKTAHLQCHIGTDSLSLVRLGADVTGLDFSQPAVEAARALSERFDFPARFECGRIEEASTLLGESAYDLVFTSDGVLIWLPDLNAWAREIAALLKPAGRFFLTDVHPFANTLGDQWCESAESLEPIAPRIPFAYPYFESQAGVIFDEPGTYAGPSKDTHYNTSVEWPHPVSSIVNALIGAGLRIDALMESHVCCYQRYPCMTQREDGLWELPDPLRTRIPMRLSIRASKA